MGDLAVVYLEADDIDTAMAALGGSQDPFDQWFREHVRDVHGIALDEGFSPPVPILDFDISRARQ
jgi:hypothetical protein